MRLIDGDEADEIARQSSGSVVHPLGSAYMSRDVVCTLGRRVTAPNVEEQIIAARTDCALSVG